MTESILTIRRTLERIRVLALNNEFSGQPAYEVVVDGKPCHCAVGALLHPETLYDIVRIGSNHEYIGEVLSKLKVADPIELTGLDLHRLAPLQSRHDYHHSVRKDIDDAEVRELANRDVLQWVTHELATLF
ncbi:hypothetical protein WS89_22560 [Burkholderia sp. MSMB1072]|uniref:hypothetical protein n=1 Tax=Burkholderia sp. MSMB1072 TaxID=1637871 RepID=UPI000758D3F0|nr:hypothetical protein [Burkholderia sp. MSMB1072]KVH56763.1 hypothetical protein WS89_22560 [Burkholderia sp. MSMB1072]